MAGADPIPLTRWFPVAASQELVRRHVFQTELFEHELAVWRADDGQVNVWENRCPHRGSRLTLGCNLGEELRCQYHGWRYASGSGRCTSIPAHPDLVPPPRIRVKQYQTCDKYGFAWTRLAGDGAEPDMPELDVGSRLTLRSIPIRAAHEIIAQALMAHEHRPFSRAVGATARGNRVRSLDEFTFLATTEGGEAAETLLYLIQPVRRDRTVIHGALLAPSADEHRLAILRHHSDQLSELRREIEDGASQSSDARTAGPGMSLERVAPVTGSWVDADPEYAP